jgi:hypothetical protein
MNEQKLPQIDSIQELARFWDSHDLTDFEGELEEVEEPVFGRESSITVQLDASDAQAIHNFAESKGIADSELVRQWVLERIHSGESS